MTDEKPRVIIIPPKPELQQTTAVTKQLRVAAYCRVSTKEEEQASSYEAQCEYYTDKIMSNKEWTMAGIFADEGITGTSTKKRTEFLRMIRQCKQKKIDLILTYKIHSAVRPQHARLHQLYAHPPTTWDRGSLRKREYQLPAD